jgi:alkylation response protein AidB-like acyl-CoA dehydrogenase
MPFAEPVAEHRKLRAEVRDFLAEETRATTDFGASMFDRDFSRRLAARGWLGMAIPREYGGHGLSLVDQFVVAEELLAARAPIGAHHAAERQTAPMLLRFGSAEQKSRFLPGIASGDLGFALGMSEPDSGSDLASVRTRAHPVNGGWTVTGTKIWTSWADRVEYAVVLCRTASTGRKHEGLSQLIVDLHADGVEVSPIPTVDGRAHFCEVSLRDVNVDDDMVLGEAGNGWQQVTSELAYERSGPDRWLSTFRVYRALVAALPELEADARVAAGRCAAWYLALHELSHGIALAASQGRDPATEAALVKDLGTRLEHEVLEIARRYMADQVPEANRADVTRAVLDAVLISPGYTIRGGTSEILRTVVARELCR